MTIEIIDVGNGIKIEVEEPISAKPYDGNAITIDPENDGLPFQEMLAAGLVAA